MVIKSDLSEIGVVLDQFVNTRTCSLSEGNSGERVVKCLYQGRVTDWTQPVILHGLALQAELRVMFSL